MIRVMNERIQIHPEICHGKPVIRGTRVLVSVILGALAAGDSQEMIVEDYPGLTKADLAAALEFASQMTGYQELAYHAAA
jgi:uncharacterized protein (DUF433 family)